MLVTQQYATVCVYVTARSYPTYVGHAGTGGMASVPIRVLDLLQRRADDNNSCSAMQVGKEPSNCSHTASTHKYYGTVVLKGEHWQGRLTYASPLNLAQLVMHKGLL